MTVHMAVKPGGPCTCGVPGYYARLACGCETWTHGEPKIDEYITCHTLAHQSSYKVLSVRSEAPSEQPR